MPPRASAVAMEAFEIARFDRALVTLFGSDGADGLMAWWLDGGRRRLGRIDQSKACKEASGTPAT